MLRIYGLKKTTLIDYPGHIACTAFTHGCTLRCPFCHNPELVVEKADDRNSMTDKELLAFLMKRKGKIEGVVFSGGEPLLHFKELKNIFRTIKEEGFLIKIDTNGTFPDALEYLVQKSLIDFVAMDFKTVPEEYTTMKASPRHVKSFLKSLKFLKKCGIDYEMRTTLVPGIHTEQSLNSMMKYIKDVPRYVLQNFEPNGTVDPSFKHTKPFSREQMRSFLKIARAENPSATIRLPD